MKIKNVFKNVSVKAGKFLAVATAKTKQHSPEILVISGIVGVVTAAVMACKATTRAADILAEAQETIDAIHGVEKDEALSKKYNPEDKKKALAIVYIRTGVKFIKLYGPSVALGALSIAGILESNNILKKRNVTLAAAYTALDKGFKEYRSHVVERFGEDVDKELRYNVLAREFVETVTDADGQESIRQKTVDISYPDTETQYARFFDEACEGWTKDAEANLIFLRFKQAEANDKLKAKGFLFLNEVYEMLGIPVTKAGQLVGWEYRPDDPKHIGDNYVDFGIYNVNREKNRDFVNGYERSILLDFNVDGVIAENAEKIAKKNHEALWRARK